MCKILSVAVHGLTKTTPKLTYDRSNSLTIAATRLTISLFGFGFKWNRATTYPVPRTPYFMGLSGQISTVPRFELHFTFSCAPAQQDAMTIESSMTPIREISYCRFLPQIYAIHITT